MHRLVGLPFIMREAHAYLFFDFSHNLRRPSDGGPGSVTLYTNFWRSIEAALMINQKEDCTTKTGGGLEGWRNIPQIRLHCREKNLTNGEFLSVVGRNLKFIPKCSLDRSGMRMQAS